MPDINIWSYIVGSLVDFPGNPAITLFTQGCNMACMFCHNLEPMSNAKLYSPDYIEALLTSVPMVDALVITGGEPCLQKNLIEFIMFVKKEFNYKIKLDTNGTMPDVLDILLREKLIDFVAMDIKCHFDNYIQHGYFGSKSLLYRSVEYIRANSVDFQFRTTDFNLTEMDRKFISEHFPDIKMQKFIKRG